MWFPADLDQNQGTFFELAYSGDAYLPLSSSPASCLAAKRLFPAAARAR